MTATVLWSSAVISLWNTFRKCNSEESMLIIQIKPLQKVPFTMSTFFRLLQAVICYCTSNLIYAKNTVTELLLIIFFLVSADWKSIFWLKINKTARKWSFLLLLCSRPFRIQIICLQRSHSWFMKLWKRSTMPFLWEIYYAIS